MKKSNCLIVAIALVASAFLLWLWFHLGFNEVDNPLDLALSILWWVVVALVVIVIARVEHKRRELIRTVYVSPAALFNSERGTVPVSCAADRMGAMQEVLRGLSYGFERKDMPSREDFDCLFVVRTKKYKASQAGGQPGQSGSAPAGADSEAEWEGTVVKVDHAGGNTETAFSSARELAALLGA